MSQLLLIRGAKQLITLRGLPGLRRGTALRDLAIIEDGSLLIRDGVIVQIGSTRRIENLKEIRGAAEIDVRGAIVMPGFVDCGIQVRPAPYAAHGKRKKMLDFFEDSLTLMRSCLQHGTLNARVKASMQPEALDSGLSLLRQLAHIGDNPVGMIRSWRIERDVTRRTSILPAYAAAFATLAKRKLAHRLEIAPPSATTRDEELLSEAAANRLAIDLQWTGGSPRVLADMLSQFQPVSVTFPYDATSEECEVLEHYAGPVVFSPAASIQDEKHSQAVRRMLDAGAAITLASGYDPHKLRGFNMQMAVTLGVLRMNLTTEEAISAATINAAYATGLGHLVGSLERGKRADLLVLNMPNYRELPARFGVNNVGMAIRHGKIAYNRTGWKVSAA